MSDQGTTEQATTEPTAVAAPGHTVSAIAKFVAGQGGQATAVIEAIGAAGVRIAVVGSSGGILADQVVPDVATAEAVVNAVDGLTAGEWDRALVSSTTVNPSHYRKMAGWVAGQKRFPKPRNRAAL